MRSRQAGEGKIGCVLWLLAFAVAGMVAFKMIPIKIKSAELEDHMIEQCKWAGNAPVDNLRKAVLSKAHELQLPLKEDDIKIEKTRERVRMEASYTVPVEFPGYTHQWRFTHLVDRAIFVF